MRETREGAQLQESIRVYEGVIASFERAREQMLRRKKVAIDTVMVHLDESLRHNERTLKSLRRVLASAKHQLAQERKR